MNKSPIRFDNTTWPVPGKFHGGIKPEEYKSISNQTEIQKLNPPESLLIPIRQSIGNPGKIVVKVGDEIIQGQLLVDNTDTSGANVHAPASGIVKQISSVKLGHLSGLPETSILIHCNNHSEQKNGDSSSGTVTEFRFELLDWLSAPPEVLLARVQQAGIVGLGGATFPTHIKLSKKLDQLIVNAMECEPYITCDDRMLRELAAQVVAGAQITAKTLNAELIIFAIEDNKSEAIASLQKEILTNNAPTKMQIYVAPTKYPSGGEKQLIELIHNIQLPHNKLPASQGMVIQNVATVHAIFKAVQQGKPLTSRLVTVTGNQVSRPGNYWIPFGTSVEFIIKKLCINNTDENSRSVIMGGPLMGQKVSNLKMVITKKSNCLIINDNKNEKNWLTEATSHQQCIRCSECEKVCPAQLLPQQLYWFSQSEQWDKLQAQGLKDCIECGACAYVCPSKIPLVHYYRFAKSSIQQKQLNQNKSDKAKSRFEFREMRIARQKQERKMKHQKAAENRKMASKDLSDDPAGKQNAINEALARVKQKKNHLSNQNAPGKEE